MLSENGVSYSDCLSKRAQEGIVVCRTASVVSCSAGEFIGEYDPETNPRGVIDMHSAENKMVFDLLREKLQSCVESPKTWADNMFLHAYDEPEGVFELRDAVAKFLTVTARAHNPLDPNKMMVINGAYPGLEAMGHVICDAGEAVLLPVPGYYGVYSSLKIRANVDVVPILLTEEQRSGETEPFQLTVERTEEAYQKAVHEGIRVKGLFLVNPNNPLGDVYSRTQVLDLLKFAKRHDLHVVLDEVYMNCVFNDATSHCSIFQFSEDEIPDLHKVHVIWTFSKDLGMSGMRIAVIYTWNKAVRDALISIAHFQAVPTGWQRMMARMLADTDWFANVFLPFSLGKLKEIHSYFVEGLRKIGIPCLHRPSGLYVWADLSKFLSAPTSEAELELNQKLLESGVQFSPGLNCQGRERGWFRVVFARIKTRKTIELGKKS
ncbi:1-aminocyclopropane-1-carboxylate synthase-like protein 1 [Acanthaster planci]|uniref:1-aminocyclopropane-1-carboxylate synthase-like protein 1 n=1 Tax=Acanthaster planci TaxID=133434 RepID=A0A8B7XTU5_ACAPL|nr:1-aminocyclopropane-1-carboxylate synthase-like protein 1 [Acanthaster planci]